MKFADVLEIRNGRNQRQVERENGQYPIYGSGGVIGRADEYICDAETVVIGRKGSINHPIFVEEPFWNVDTAFGLVAQRQVLLPKYLYYFCVNYDFEKLNTTVTIPSLTKANLLQVEIEVPDLVTQCTIVRILDKIDYLMDLRQQQLRRLDLAVKSRFIELFGDPVVNTFGWEQVLLREVTSKIGSGATPRGGKESYQAEGITFIRSMNVHDGRFEYKDIAYITEAQATQLDNVTVEENDVFINITGASVARSCIVPREVLPARVNQHVAIIRCVRNRLHPIFANHMFLNDGFKSQLLDIGESGGATRQAITKQQLETLTVILPPLELQQQFAAFAEQTDKSKLAVQKSLEQLEILKKSLMQRYFS